MVINIGLDFGTSSTKVAFYESDTEKHFLYVFNSLQKDLSRYCFNSVIRIYGNKVYFDEGDGHMIRLFKTGMEAKEYKCVRPFFKKNIRGHQLVAIYCAFVLKEVKKFLKKKYPDVKIIIQCGIPIDHLNEEHLSTNEKLKEKKFRLAFFIADLLSENKKVYTGCRLEEVLSEIETIEKNYIEEAPGQRKVEIYPETMAGIASLLKDQTLPHRYRYSIVDIGAGTTDMSFFEFRDNIVSEGKFSVYFSKTLNVGAENYESLPKAKNEIRNDFKKGFYQSLSLCPNKWDSNFKLLYLGGGSRGELKHSLNKMDSLTVSGNGLTKHIIEPEEIKLPLPQDVYDCIDAREKAWTNYFDILALAYGLSVPSAFMPVYNSQVQPMQRLIAERLPEESLTPDVG